MRGAATAVWSKAASSPASSSAMSIRPPSIEILESHSSQSIPRKHVLTTLDSSREEAEHSWK
ncbi:hypothetical protein GCM10027612_72630 [Microbispora bryophytorum subsp. camponoti]